MLVLEIEYLQRVSYAARYNLPGEPEWPPHPDRVFMALVDAWGVSGRSTSGADALRWLESQGPPEIAAPKASRRSAFRNYVPTSSNGAQGLGYLDAGNILDIVQSVVRKDRAFPAFALHGDRPAVLMIWRDASPDAAALESLGHLAGRVSHVGHSASLTRISVSTGTDARPTHVEGGEGGATMLRCPHPGRFDTLVSEFDAASPTIPSWPTTAPTRRYGRPRGAVAEGPMGPGDEWVVLAASGGGLVPVIGAFPAVAQALRDAVVSHAECPVHEAVSGRVPGGGPVKGPHLAIVPMANVGWGGYSDGSLLGVALLLPRASSYGTPERRQMRRAVSSFLDPKRGGGSLRLGAFGEMSLRRYVDGAKKSLLPDRYTGVDRTWASATPVVLDRHPKKRHSAADVVADCCVRAGLPRPSSVETSRRSSVPGAPPALVGGGGRKGWLPPRPGALDGRFVCHAVVTFETDVRGPVLVGAGRYYGMGLFLPAAVARP